MNTEPSDPEITTVTDTDAIGKPTEATERHDNQAEETGPTPEPTSEPTPDEKPTEARGISDSELAEAERRAYLKGRNDGIAEALSGPGLWQLAPDDGEGTAPLPDVPILQAMRPSIWDL